MRSEPHPFVRADPMDQDGETGAVIAGSFCRSARTAPVFLGFAYVAFPSARSASFIAAKSAVGVDLAADLEELRWILRLQLLGEPL